MRWTWSLLLLAMSACEKAGGDVKTIERPLPKVTVRMIDPGREPRAPLRNHGHAGASGRYHMTYTLQASYPHAPPRTMTTTLDYESTVIDVLPDGGTHTRQRMLDGDPRTQAIRGRVADIWRDARGVYVRPTLLTLGPKDPGDTTSGAQPELATVAPEEPVGVGGRWHEDITQGDDTASIEVELLARDGDHVRQRVTFHSTGVMWGFPATRDGTMMEEFDLSGAEGSLHGDIAFVVQARQGTVNATGTLDVVTLP